MINYFASGRLTGYLAEWIVLEDKCANQRFNAADTSPLSWDRFFSHLARWFGVVKGVAAPDLGEDYPIVITGKLGKESPMGYGPARVIRLNFTLEEWASREENHAAWKELMEASGGKLKFDPFVDVQASFGYGDAAIMTSGFCLSMDKARRMGWTGFVDSVEAIFEMFGEMSEMGLGKDMVVKEV